MGSLWRIVAPAADVAPTTIAQDVVDLVLCEAGGVCSVDSKLGRLQGKVGQVASMSATCACLFFNLYIRRKWQIYNYLIKSIRNCLHMPCVKVDILHYKKRITSLLPP